MEANLAIVDAKLVDTVAGTLAEIGMQTLRETLVEVEAKALVDTLFETRQETMT